MHILRTLSIVAVAAVPAAGTAVAAPPQNSWADIESAVVAETNAVRAQKGLPALRSTPRLRRAARGHSRFLSTTGLFQHEDGRGRPFWNRLVRAGYPRSATMAENIAMVGGTCSPEVAAEAVRMWMASPPHRANLLHRRMRAVGVGVVASPDCSRIYFTADYGSLAR